MRVRDVLDEGQVGSGVAAYAVAHPCGVSGISRQSETLPLGVQPEVSSLGDLSTVPPGGVGHVKVAHYNE